MLATLTRLVLIAVVTFLPGMIAWVVEERRYRRNTEG